MAEKENNGGHGMPHLRRPHLSGIVILLFAVFVATSGMAGFTLGRNSARSTGALVDTIVLSPGDSSSRAQAVLHYLSGALRSREGMPCAGFTVRLDENREDVTDQNGKFYLADLRSGSHVLEVLDEKRELVASTPLSLEFSGGTIERSGSGGTPSFVMPEDTRLLELTFVMDEEGNLVPEENSALFTTRDGQLLNFDGAGLRVRENSLVVTPEGSIAAPDGEVVLPSQKVAITKTGAQTEVKEEEEVLPGLTVKEDGSAETEDGIKILPNGEVKLPGGEIVGGDTPVEIDNGEVTEPDLLPDAYVPGEAPAVPEEDGLPEETDSASQAEETASGEDTEPEEPTGGLSVADGASGISWKQQSFVDLFQNRTVGAELGEENGIPVAAPGSKGYYDFTLENPEQYDIAYTISIEERTFHLPILYTVVDRADNTHHLHRQRTDGKNALVSPKITIPAGTRQNFSIEWAWQYEDWFDPESDDALDMAATNSADRCYEVTLSIQAEQISPPEVIEPGDDTKYPGQH